MSWQAGTGFSYKEKRQWFSGQQAWAVVRQKILNGNSKKFLLVHVDLEKVLQDMINKLIEIG
jgi:hypothetical protein